MAQVRIIANYTTPDIQDNFAVDVTLDTVFTPQPGTDADLALARTVMIALNTDRRALPDDQLPDPTSKDRRGWCFDTDAETIRGGWPIGTRLWLLQRAKLTGYGSKQGSTVELAKRYIAEALQPFVDHKICTSFDINISQTAISTISGTIIMYRGEDSSLNLEYEDLWTVYQ